MPYALPVFFFSLIFSFFWGSKIQTSPIGLAQQLAPPLSEFEFGCAGFDGVGLGGLGYVRLHQALPL
jgi:hypothetical protein